MARYLQPNIVKAAVARLSESRASKSMLHFLVFKRASTRAHEPLVSFSNGNANLGNAVDDLAHCALNGAVLPPSLRDRPYVNVFGPSDSAWQYRNAGWRTNGTGPALSGAVWRGIIKIVSERPRSGQLTPGYTEKLPGVLLKSGARLPALDDAAIWFHRADDLEGQVAAVTDGAALGTHLRESFTQKLGLTNDEIAVLFDSTQAPLAGQALGDVLQDTVADPREYLPSLPEEDTGSGELAELLAAFETLANSSGLRLGRPLLLRFAAALGAKRFLILSGLAGSGKTKLAQAFARWLTPAVEAGELAAYAVIPVGADWTGNDNILGYPDGLDPARGRVM